MSNRQPRLSRRRILQLGALGPLAILAARSAGAMEFGDVANVRPELPPKRMNELVGKGKKHRPGMNEGEFRRVVKELWRHFQSGVAYEDPAAKIPNDPQKLKELLTAAFEVENKNKEQSGKLITERLDDWGDVEELTNVCAFLCGQYSAENAGGAEIDGAHYGQAYGRVEKEMKKKSARLRSLQAARGGTIIKLGGGC